MRAIRVMWIDGQTRDVCGTAPAKLALRRADDGRCRWYCQAYNEAGLPAGDCDQETGVDGATMTEAIGTAFAAWGGHPWNLRTTRAG